MAKQIELPGIHRKPTSEDIKELVKFRLLGFELRQQERARRRAGAGDPPGGGEGPPAQEELFPAEPPKPDR